MTGNGERHQLSLLQPGTHEAEPGRLRLLTWNVQHANASRSQRQADWVAAQDADVVVLTEVAPGGHALAQALDERGFAVHHGDGGVDYLTVIASRVGKAEPADLGVAHLPHRCAAVRLHLDHGVSVGVVGLYVPSRGPNERRNVDKRAFQKAAAAVLPGLADSLDVQGPIVIAGDLNVVEPDHQPHHSVFGGWEYDFYRAFAAAGYGDAFRHCRPDTVDHSWYGRRSGDGYRFDHMFCSPVTAVTGCSYAHEPRLERLSDHAVMTATITV
ncbi:endonuclease/exonuclease/phosphatase family protein [Nonomuraea jabiensis]|uniref:endonuclease/exonuclease/phosphatase family protein n=1 Tax=Nonomuraea jabiensis TaxID=882448 RepID=UPI003D73B653